jgi:hypothetical protein
MWSHMLTFTNVSLLGKKKLLGVVIREIFFSQVLDVFP